MDQLALARMKSFSQFLKTHKGAGVACVMLLIFTQANYNNTQFSMLTGYSRDSCGKALDYLLFHDVVIRRGQKWHLETPWVEQLPLPYQLIQAGKVSKISTLSSPSSSLLVNIPNNNIDIQTNKPTILEVSIFPTLQEKSISEVIPLVDNPVDNFLRELGVTNPKRAELVALPHINLEYLKAHLHKLESEGHSGQIGLLIHRASSNWRVAKCSCGPCLEKQRLSQQIPDHLKSIIKR